MSSSSKVEEYQDDSITFFNPFLLRSYNCLFKASILFSAASVTILFYGRVVEVSTRAISRNGGIISQETNICNVD